MATPTAAELKTLPPEDARNAANYNTPLPPNDPASVSGARDNVTYIGPTNFSNLQKQYTPYQIEQATKRDAQGNIFWNSEVNIADIPVAPPTPGMTPSVSSTPKADEISRYSEAPSIPSAQNPTLEISKSINQAADKFLTTEIDRTLQDLLKQQTEAANAEKLLAQQKQDALTNRLSEISQSTLAQDALEASRKKFEVDANIERYQTIQQNIIDAQSALDQGLVYEASRPVRMALMTGRSNELRQQGLAMIGTMQATASLVKGNIEMAEAYANNTIDAINVDNARQEKAIYTLLDLASKDVVRLDDIERESLNQRLAMIADQSETLKKNKDAVLELMTSAPTASLKGRVLLTDSPEAAIQKMLPFLSEQEQAEFALTRSKIKGGSGGSGKAIPSNLEDWRADLSVGERTYLAEAVGATLDFETREEAIQFLIDNRATFQAKLGEDGVKYLAAQIDSKFGVQEEGVDEEAPIEGEGERAPVIEATPGGFGKAVGQGFNAIGDSLSKMVELSPLGYISRGLSGKGLSKDQTAQVNQAQEFLNGLLGE